MPNVVKVKVVCAWCWRFLGGVKNCRDVSHGICLPCFSREMGFSVEASVDLWEMWRDDGGEG